MPTIEENRSIWDDSYDWRDAGEEWSSRWGGSYMQWYGTILPRIRSLLPVDTILEIAPRYGRWTRFLREYCRRLIIVDLSEQCIEACRHRFADCSHITYFVNDGASLDMIPDGSIDFAFSFDSLVHAEDIVLEKYVSQMPAKLSPDGSAFIHHSNLEAFDTFLKLDAAISKIPKLRPLLVRSGILDDVRSQGRSTTMSAAKMKCYAGENGLGCVTQELVSWNSRRAIDCLSTLMRKSSPRYRKTLEWVNTSFFDEAAYLSKLSRLYVPESHS